jgi:hypothetical protein
MGADLAADLEEAEAEGGSPEDVLGNSAFDPRRFAAAWATARGVTGPPTSDRVSPWRTPATVVLTVLLGTLTFITALALLVGRHSSSIAVAAHRFVAGRGPLRLFLPGAGRMVIPAPQGPFVAIHDVGVGGVHPLVLMLLVVGLVGLGLLAVVNWSPWLGPRRYHRHESRRAQR